MDDMEIIGGRLDHLSENGLKNLVRELQTKLYAAHSRESSQQARIERLEEAIKKAYKEMEIHDNAYFQCESVEGAGGAMDAMETLKKALSPTPPAGEGRL